MKRIQKIAALFLSFLLMTQLMLVPAVGEQTSNAAQSTEGSPTIQAPTMEEEELEPYAVGEEIEAWREEGVRHYYFGDGVYEAVVKAEKQSAGSDAKASSNTTTPSLGEPYETYISSSHPSTVYGRESTLYVGIAEIGLFWHEEPSLPENAVIVTAKLNFFYYYGISTGHMLVGAYPVNVTWNESDSWNSVQTKATNSGLPNMGIGTEKAGQIQLDASPTCTASNPTQTSVFVTTIVQSWYSGEYDNDGIALKRIALNDGEENNSVIIKPYEAEEEYWSYLTIQYRLADEDDGYIPEGDYFLQNVELGNYAQINNNVSPTTHGAIIEAWDFDGANDQKWHFTSLYNGYYKITSIASGYALTAPSSLNASITQTTFTNADNQHWKISVTADGYQLRPRSNYSYRLAVGDGIITGNGRNVEMRAVRTDHKDEWNLVGMLPLSGYELNYDPATWAGEVESHCNCYSYAINNQLDEHNALWFKQHPGEYAQVYVPQADYYAPATSLINATASDFNSYGNNNNRNMVFVSIGQREICPAGTYKVALVIAPKDDYHWYRQDSDGYWSHKLGTTPVTRTDHSGNLIIDPQYADRGKYTQFIGYFAVTPWNNYASANAITTNVTPATYPDTFKKTISYSDLDRILIGMNYDQTVDILGTTGIDVGSGAILYQYTLEDGKQIILNYCKDSNGDLILCNLIFPQTGG